MLEEDESRYITAGVPTWDNYNDNQWKHLKALDIAGFNYTEKMYTSAHLDDPDMIIYGSETVSAFYSRGIYHMDTYGTEMYAYKAPDFQCSSYGNERFFGTAERYLLAVRDNPHVTGEFVWTGFDYLGEPAPYSWPAKSSYFGIIENGRL